MKDRVLDRIDMLLLRLDREQDAIRALRRIVEHEALTDDELLGVEQLLFRLERAL